MIKRILIVVGLILLAVGVYRLASQMSKKPKPKTAHYLIPVRSIDTMKYSRDLARTRANDPQFDEEIATQMANIASTGATHVAIATPYDEEFVPYLTRWVNAARGAGLKVWFRGNFAGWEGWFSYAPIGRQEHLAMLKDFVLDNPALFQDGDIFTSCPECENGGTGDPRNTKDVKGFREFLLTEKKTSEQLFTKINKKVTANYYSMNGDVAKLIMDRDFTKRLGGVVTIDHYVATPEQLLFDIEEIHARSGGDVVLGEWGAPIPDINGEMTAKEQARWIARSMDQLTTLPYLKGINYWVGNGGSTHLWNDDNSPRPAVSSIKRYYKPSSTPTPSP